MSRPLLRTPARLLLAAVAAAALLLLLVGVPAALLAVIGDPLPRHLPSGSDLTSALTPEEITKALAIVLWLLWLQFAAAVAAEINARATGRHLRVPAAGPSQVLARRLLATALLVTTAAGTALPAAQAATSSPAAAPPAAAAAYTTAQAAAPAGPSAAVAQAATSQVPGVPAGARYYQVTAHDTLWRIAETHLGSGARYGEIFALNRDRPQPDGSALTRAALIQPGWSLIMPEDATGCPRAAATAATASSAVHEVIVTPGDSLWAEAERAYGDGADYPAIYHASQAITQPDGRHLTDPAAIDTGWHLIIPAAPAAPSSPATPAAPPASAPAHAAPPASTPAASSPQPSAPAPQSTESPAPSSPASAAPQAAYPGETAHSPTTAASSGSRTLWEILGVGALLAAAAITLLDRHRRRQQRARRAGESIQMPAPAPTALERLLRSGADRDAAAFVDRALRTLAERARAAGTDLPDLRLALLDPTGLYLQPAVPTRLPRPFFPTDDPDWWLCPRNRDLQQPAPDVPAPYPALTTIGHDDHGRTVLIDLESARALELTGPHSLDALRALALDLLTAEHADDTAVTLVGVGLELAELDLPGQLNLAADLDGALDALTDWVTAAEQALSASGAPSVRSARLHAAPDMLTPHILITAQPPTGHSAQRLADLLQRAPAMCAAVVCGAPLSLDSAVTLPATGAPAELLPHGLAVTAQHLTEADLHALIEHLHTGQDSTPAPSWNPPQPHPDQDPDNEQPPSAADEPDRAEEQDPELWRDADIWDEPQDPAPREPDPQESDAHENDPPAASAHHPQVRVLGQVELVHARGSVEPTRRSRLIELAAYLVLHPGGDHHAVTEAVWPAGTTLTNRNTAVSKLRGWLGRDDEGRPYLPAVGSAGYRLSPAVTSDWQHFQQLTRRAATRGRAGAEDLHAALQLVRGQPFAATPPTRYAWADWPRQEMISRIADAAYELSEIRLQEHDWDGARAAATRGLLAAPESERLYRQLFKAALHAGDLAELQRLAVQLQARTEELGVDLEAETVELLDELLSRRVSTRAV